jgi:hypothetical protein
LAGCIERGLEAVKGPLRTIRRQSAILQAVAATLDEGGRRGAGKFAAIRAELAGREEDGFAGHMARVMASWSVGLFAGPADLPQDNLELERWFRLPKGHERRIHGHAHAGVRLVQEGPTLIPALDAQALHPDPFDATSLLPFRETATPSCQTQALQRRRVMRRARSKNKRRKLLQLLEKQYREAG